MFLFVVVLALVATLTFLVHALRQTGTQPRFWPWIWLSLGLAAALSIQTYNQSAALLGHRELGTLTMPLAGVAALVMIFGLWRAYVWDMAEAAERQRALAALRESEERFKSAFHHAAIGMALIGTDGRWIQVNSALCTMLGFSEAELLQKPVDSLAQPDDWSASRLPFQEVLTGKRPGFQLEMRFIHRAGRHVWGLASVSLVRNDQGAPLHAIAQIQDITERKQAELRLVDLANHDPLTGLFNRRRFFEELDRALAVARRYGTPGAVLFLDLDNFKEVNDTLGHFAGDRVLTGVAQVLRHKLRDTDTLGRLGGDEFGALLPSAEAVHAGEVAMRILQELQQQTFVIDGTSVRTTCSIGIALYSKHGATAEQVLNQADRAMYRAKERGNRFVIHTSSEQSGKSERPA